MIDSVKGELLHRKAKAIYHEAKDLRDFDRVAIFELRLSEIEDPLLRAGVEALAFSMLQLGIEERSGGEKGRLEVFIFSEIGVKCLVCSLAALISFFEFRMTLLFSLASGLVSGLVFHIIMLSFYPRYPYRKLFAYCLVSSFALIVPSSFEIKFQNEFASILWGEPPSNSMIAVALLCIFLSFCAAIAEIMYSKK